MLNSFTSSFSGYTTRFFLVQGSVLLVLFGATVILVRDFIEPNDRVVTSLELIQQETTPDAAFGDSHFAWGFVGSRDFPTLGAEGETLRDMELRVRYYYRDKQPGKVVIQGDPHSFAVYKVERGTHDYLQNMDNRFWQRFLEHHRQYMGKYWQRVIQHGGFDVFRSADEMRWGWIVGHARWSSRDSSGRVGLARAREIWQRPDSGFRNGESAQSYKRTLAYLKGRGADVCVVTTPVSYEYFQYAKDDSSTAAAINYVRRVAEQTGARYFNYFDLYARPEFASYFRDMDHLNEIGAPKFTTKVLSDCFGGPAIGAPGGSSPEMP
jgi:DltD protein